MFFNKLRYVCYFVMSHFDTKAGNICRFIVCLRKKVLEVVQKICFLSHVAFIILVLYSLKPTSIMSRK